MNWLESQQLLLNGDYDNGWPSHDIVVRHNPQLGVTPASDFGKPIWDGKHEPITLLINAEFGDGDTIHFWRFVHLAQKRVKKVILRCNGELKELFYGVDCVDKDDQLPSFDKIIHMMALPKALNVKKKDIDGKPYLNLHYEPKKPVRIFSLLKLFKVGICWAGNPFAPRDHLRTIPPELFQPFQPTEKIKFFSLNKLFAPPENLIDVRPLMDDWNETAHLINTMDLIITVETAVAILAGALGKPVWILVPEDPDWRFGLHGEKTLWYDSAKLYRQNGPWKDILNKVLQDLKAHVSSWTLEQPAGLLGGSSEPASILSV